MFISTQRNHQTPSLELSENKNKKKKKKDQISQFEDRIKEINIQQAANRQQQQ